MRGKSNACLRLGIYRYRDRILVEPFPLTHGLRYWRLQKPADRKVGPSEAKRKRAGTRSPGPAPCFRRRCCELALELQPDGERQHAGSGRTIDVAENRRITHLIRGRVELDTGPDAVDFRVIENVVGLRLEAQDTFFTTQ